ncbi:hypothetical protein [Comamonas sp. GB3 AK4-5]|uniref:hypothetical protein n=1 Tax=Comamonas sp. GB3 AK4-5 TaxID=3231487 RepID=UPI00351DB1C5
MTHSQHFPLNDEDDTAGLPPHFQARIVGPVQHRVGDGVLEPIPQNLQVQVDVAIASMVLSWVSDAQPVTVTLAREEFLEYVDIGAIQIVA